MRRLGRILACLIATATGFGDDAGAEEATWDAPETSAEVVTLLDGVTPATLEDIRTAIAGWRDTEKLRLLEFGAAAADEHGMVGTLLIPPTRLG